jgi:hypothetical protein
MAARTRGGTRHGNPRYSHLRKQRATEGAGISSFFWSMTWPTLKACGLEIPGYHYHCYHPYQLVFVSVAAVINMVSFGLFMLMWFGGLFGVCIVGAVASLTFEIVRGYLWHKYIL